MKYVIHRGSEAACRDTLARVLAATTVPEGTWAVTTYAPGTEDTHAFCADLSPRNPAWPKEKPKLVPVCGILGVLGFGHFTNHGQGYGLKPTRTQALEDCERAGQKWIAAHPGPATDLPVVEEATDEPQA